MTRERAGFTVVELLVGIAVALAVAVAAVAASATALRLLARAAFRAEADDLVHAALETFTLDVRRAGFDPRGAGFDAVVEASETRLGVASDGDGDGVVDAASEERTTLACDVAGGRLSRIVGSQSLPLLSRVVACRFGYADAAGTSLTPPPAGLDAATRRLVRRVTLDVAVVPPGAGVPSVGRAAAALRTAS